MNFDFVPPNNNYNNSFSTQMLNCICWILML